MGLSLRPLGRKIVDIFSADTEEDQRRRMSAGQPRFYADQQRQAGNKRPATNVGSAFLGSTARLANTARAGLGGAYGLGRTGVSSIFGDDEDYQRTLADTYQTLNRDLSPTGGLFGAGTFFDSPEQAAEISAPELAKTIASQGAGVASEVLPGARGVSVAKQGVRAVPKLAGRGFAEGAGGNVAEQYISTGKVDPIEVAKAGAFGSVLEAGPSTLYAGGKQLPKAAAKGAEAARKADEAAFTPRKMRIGPEAKNTLSDWADYKMGRYKPTAKEFAELDANARKISKETGIDFINGSNEAIDLRVADFLDPTVRRQVAQGGYVQAPARPKVKAKTEAPDLSKNTIDPTDPFGNRKLRKRVKNEAGRLFVDEDAEMINMLRRLEKETGQKGLVDDWMFNTNTQRASPSIANAKMRQSKEFGEAFAGLSKREADEFDDFLSARAELKNYEGLPTTRSKQQLQSVYDDLAPKYEQRFHALNADNKKWTQDLLEAGIIDQDTAGKWLADNDYIRVQRDMEDLLGVQRPSSRSRSFGSTSTKQKRTGSKREIISPTKTAVSRRQQLQQEIQKNKTASETIDVLSEAGIAQQVDDATRKNVIKRFADGKVQYWEVPQDIKRIVDNVSPYQLGVIAKIVSTPARVFRAGTTALSAPFTVTNYLRDQASSAIYSKSVLDTHNPANIASGMFQASKDFGTTGKNSSELWDKFISFAGDQTVYDELRNVKSTNRFLREARRGGKGKAFNMATAPVRTLEDLNSITERATRFQNFKGMYKKVLKESGDEEQAIRAAVQAAYQNSVNFQRSGQVTKVLNLLIPYFNAGIQGSRNVVRSFRDRPFATTAKSAGLIAAPTMAVTAYNMADAERKEIYDSIPEYEKRDNFIVILPGAKQRSDGRWEGLIKVPKPQGYRELTDPSREIMEAWAGGEEPDNVAVIAKDMIGGLTGPVNIEDLNKFGSSFIPAAAKPYIQQQANKDLYTGSQIVPDFMVEGTDDPTKRAFEGTSGTARQIAKVLGVEPTRVEKYVEDTFGSLGRYGLNTSDNILAKAGAIPEDQIGGRSVVQDFSRRLFEAQGELLEKNKSAGQKYYESREEAIEAVGLNKNEQAAYDSLHPDKTNFLGEDIFDENKRLSKYTKAGIYLQHPKTFLVDKKVDEAQRKRGRAGNPLYDLKGDQLNKVLLKQALPPGASDPELDNLWKEDWYQDYRNATSKFYDSIKTSLKKEGKALPKSNYPVTPDNLQKVMDTYSALPKGTGDRSAWIKSNPGLWKKMTDQWAKVDAWENKERVKIGLKELTDEDKGFSSGKGFGRSGGSYDRSPGSAYKYAISLSAGGSTKTPTVSVKKSGGVKSTVSRSTAKPKVSLKRSLV